MLYKTAEFRKQAAVPNATETFTAGAELIFKSAATGNFRRSKDLVIKEK
jgi:hypothetical protein